jgi:hypothetical protein
MEWFFNNLLVRLLLPFDLSPLNQLIAIADRRFELRTIQNANRARACKQSCLLFWRMPAGV